MRSSGNRGALARATAAIGDDWASFLRLPGAIVCRSIVFVGLTAFVSLYAHRRTGGGEAAGTAALCVLFGGGALGAVAGAAPRTGSGGARWCAGRTR
ncbi:hypothetical protein ACFY1U_32980 [Streptomyces sp. NPDC001351]|uniref:hypothetical protein n=1 Tax=Streptomyces sp. NPDC001351 TaxID=3364564 RepID=UPI003681ABA5